MPEFVEVKPKKSETRFKSEKIAYWFFRLNGCFLLENFLVHHERRGREGTDVDILSVRFPFRQELSLSGNAMPDHPIFNSDGKIDIILAEIKKGRCSINSSWLNSLSLNMERILHIVGAVPPDQVAKIAEKLYEDNFYENSSYRIRLFAVGLEKNIELRKSIIQMEWSDILLFIHSRFLPYWRYKTQHRQWDVTGKNLFLLTGEFRDDPELFINSVVSRMTE